MNNLAQAEIVVYALVFLALFFIGGIIGVASFSEFEGRFFISGSILGIFGTGAGLLIIKVVAHR